MKHTRRCVQRLRPQALQNPQDSPKRGGLHSSGAVAAEYVYDPYGNVVEATGALAEQFSFGFSTKVHDRELGLVAYQRRFLRPAIGRWINRDPIEEEGSINLFFFVQNSPICCFDTDGRFVFPIIIDPNPPPPHEPIPDILDHFGNSTDPLGEEKWFERHYAGWLAEARKRFSAEINAGIDCKTQTFNGPSTRINIYPSDDRGGSATKQTPGGNEQEYGDRGQSDWSADKILGSFSIDYETPVTVRYTSVDGKKRKFVWETKMYVADVLGTQEGDRIRMIPGMAAITPSRQVKRASWILRGSGECCAK